MWIQNHSFGVGVVDCSRIGRNRIASPVTMSDAGCGSEFRDNSGPERIHD